MRDSVGTATGRGAWRGAWRGRVSSQRRFHFGSSALQEGRPIRAFTGPSTPPGRGRRWHGWWSRRRRRGGALNTPPFALPLSLSLALPPHSPSRPVRPAAAGSPSARTHTYTLPHIGSRCARSHSTSTSEGVLTRECRPRIYFAFFSCLLCVYGHRVQCKEVPPCLRSKGLEC